MHGGIRFVCAALTTDLLVGCGASSTPSAPAPLASSTAYELVLLKKPDSNDAIVKIDRAVYDLCVNTVQLSHMTAKPFPPLPPVLNGIRTTYLIRGRDRVVRTEALAVLDISKMTPERGCEVDVNTPTHSTVDMVIGATHTVIATDDSGKPTVHTEDLSELQRMDPPQAQSTAKFTVSRTVNGIEIRCLPEGRPPLDGDQLQEMCVYAHDNVLVEPSGKPITLASRVKPAPRVEYVMVTEPQSLRTLEHPDPSQFDAATYAR